MIETDTKRVAHHLPGFAHKTPKAKKSFQGLIVQNNIV